MTSQGESLGNPNLKGFPNWNFFPLWLAGQPVFLIFFRFQDDIYV